MDAIQAQIHNWLYNPYRLRIWNNVATSVANSTTAEFPFDTFSASNDPDAMGGTANPILPTIDVAGYYLMTCNIGAVGGVAGNAWFGRILINGVAVTYDNLDRIDAVGAGDQIQVNFAKIMKLNRGDTISVALFQNSGAGKNSVNGEGESWLELTLLGPA